MKSKILLLVFLQFVITSLPAYGETSIVPDEVPNARLGKAVRDAIDQSINNYADSLNLDFTSYHSCTSLNYITEESNYVLSDGTCIQVRVIIKSKSEAEVIPDSQPVDSIALNFKEKLDEALEATNLKN